jgi:CDP-diacylglycerol--glycerol-3-phosphate 3-phosphatidyltransferase
VGRFFRRTQIKAGESEHMRVGKVERMNLPNKLTVSRFVMTGFFVGCMAWGREYEALHAAYEMPAAPHGYGRPIGWNFAYTAALVLFLAAAITDYLDGAIARKRGLESNFGKLMDPLADKVLMAAGFITLMPLRAVPAWMVICIIAREFLITGLRLVAAGRGIVLQAEKVGKHKTAWQMVTVAYFLLLLGVAEFDRQGLLPLRAEVWWWYAWRYLGWTLAGVALVLTVYSGLVYLWRHRDLISEDR